MNNELNIDHLLGVPDGADSGCAAGFEVLHHYVEAELAGHDPALRQPGLATHLRNCPACRSDFLGLLDAIRHFGDIAP